ncbi:MAG: hypothetical protein MKZ85_13695 [Pedosphaera sp.]|nr:hypothetical protein [Pedosphaera sp.]
MGRVGLNVDRRFLNWDVFFTQPGHAENPGPVDCSCNTGGDAGEHTCKQGFVEGLFCGISVYQGLDEKYAGAAGEKSQKARNGKSQTSSGECCAEEGIVY